MLKKLLRYDFKAVFKYWWIAALVSFVLSIGGGICIKLLGSEKILPEAIYIISILVIVSVVISYVVFSFLSTILVFTRFYKNFFTDEGYLTFTLPVKRTQLLNSKLILSVTTSIVTMLTCIFNILIMICIGLADVIFTKGFWVNAKYLFDTLVNDAGWYLLLYVLELFILLLLSTIFSSLFLFICISFASIITKKAKVITAIGIYYGANTIFTFIMQIFFMFGIPSLSYWMSDLPAASEHPMTSLIFLGILLFMGIFCMLLYTLQYWMIDHKLNLN